MGVVANIGRMPGSVLAGDTDLLFLDGTASEVSAPLGILLATGTSAPQLNFGKDSGVPAVLGDNFGGLFFRGAKNSAGGMSTAGGMRGMAEDDWDDAGALGGTRGQIQFLTANQEPVGFGTYGMRVRMTLDSNGALWLGETTAAALFSVDQTGSLTVGTTALPKLTVDGASGDLATLGNLKVAGVTSNTPSSFQAVASTASRIVNPVASLALITVTTATTYTLTTTSATITATPTAPKNGQLLTILMLPSSLGSVTFTEGGSSGLMLKGGAVTLSAGEALQLVYSVSGARWCEVGGGGGAPSTTGTDLTLSGFLQVDTVANVTGNLTVGPIGVPAISLYAGTGNVSIAGTTTLHNPLVGVVGNNLELKGQAGGVGSTGSIKITSQAMFGQNVPLGSPMTRFYNSTLVSGITEAVDKTYTQYRYVMPIGDLNRNIVTETVPAGAMQVVDVIVIGTNTATNTQQWIYKFVNSFNSAGRLSNSLTVVSEFDAAYTVTCDQTGASGWKINVTRPTGLFAVSWHVHCTVYTLDT